jgi:hypothetical protein
MARLLVGALIGAGLLAATAFFWMRSDPCLGRCGDGTRCDHQRCLAAAPSAPPAVQAPKRRRRHGGSGDSNAAPEVELKPGDELPVEQGDALGRPEHLDLSKPDERELADEDIDRVIRAANGPITTCITDAVGDAPLETGRIELGLRVEKGGSVSRVRVKAPRLMMRNGLMGCLRGVTSSMRFPSSGGASVVTHSFELK